MPSHNHADGVYDKILMSDNHITVASVNDSEGEPNLASCRALVFEGGNQPHSHIMPGHDNRPRYYELFYIIRVK